MARASATFHQIVDLNIQGATLIGNDTRWKGMVTNADGDILQRSIAYSRGDTVAHNEAVWVATDPSDNEEPSDISPMWQRVSRSSAEGFVDNRFDATGRLVESYLRDGAQASTLASPASDTDNLSDQLISMLFIGFPPGAPRAQQVVISAKNTGSFVEGLDRLVDASTSSVGVISFSATDDADITRAFSVYINGGSLDADSKEFTFEVVAVTSRSTRRPIRIPFDLSPSYTFNTLEVPVGNTTQSQFVNADAITFQRLIRLNTDLHIGESEVGDLLATFPEAYGPVGPITGAYPHDGALPSIPYGPASGAIGALDMDTGRLMLSLTRNISTADAPAVGNIIGFPLIVNAAGDTVKVFGEIVANEDGVRLSGTDIQQITTIQIDGAYRAYLAYGTIHGTPTANAPSERLFDPTSNIFYFNPSILALPTDEFVNTYSRLTLSAPVIVNNGRFDSMPFATTRAELIAMTPSTGDQVVYTGPRFGSDFANDLAIASSSPDGAAQGALLVGVSNNTTRPETNIPHEGWITLSTILNGFGAETRSFNTSDCLIYLRPGDIIRGVNSTVDLTVLDIIQSSTLITGNAGGRAGIVILDQNPLTQTLTLIQQVMKARTITEPGLLTWNGTRWT